MTPPGMFSKISVTTSSPPKPRNTSENSAAPIRIRNTIEVTLVVERTTSVRVFRLSLRLARASISAPKAPTAEASVGVARPPRIEPSTQTISTIGGTRPFISSQKMLPVCPSSSISASRSTAGAFSGFSQATMAM